MVVKEIKEFFTDMADNWTDDKASFIAQVVDITALVTLVGLLGYICIL